MGTNGSIPSSLASLVLVDRQLDIVTPALHQSHVLDCIFGSLPARGSSTHGTSQSASGRTSQVANLAPGQQVQSPVHGVASTRKHLSELGAEADAEVVSAAAGDMEVQARADGGSSKTESASEAANEGSLEAADQSGSGIANEGWSDLEEGSESDLGGTLQRGAAELVHQSQQQGQQRQHRLQHQQPQQPQRSTSSLR